MVQKINFESRFIIFYNLGNQNGWPETQCKDGNKQSPIKIDPTLDDFEIIDDAQPFSFVGWDQVPKSSKLMNAGKLLKAIFEFEKPAMVSIL